MRLAAAVFLALLSAVAPVAPVAAQTAEEAAPAAAPVRLALVIGQSDYRGARLITATADAARIAQALEAAGFTTDGGADLEQHMIREKIRNLGEKARQAGAVDALFVYIAGRVAQIYGENRLLPVGASIERADDVVLNGFGINDLVNALKTIPAKARIVVIDAAAPPEQLTDDKAFSAGLALVEPPEGFLVVLSQNPGRPLLEPQPPMGFFSKGFLDALQQPAASYADTFGLARQRVFDESRNQQMPWDGDRLAKGTMGFYPLPEGVTLPSIAQHDGAETTLASMTREEAYKRVIAADSIVDYQAFLVSFPQDEAVSTIQYNLAVRREAEVWARALRDNTADGYWTYLASYPDGANVPMARQKLAELGRHDTPPVDFTPVAYPDLPPPLPRVELVASSASLPIALLPPPPPLGLAPVAEAVLTAALSVPSVSAAPHELPRVSAPPSQPAWAPRRSAFQPRTVAVSPLSVGPATTPIVAGQGGFRPIGGASPAVAGPQTMREPPGASPVASPALPTFHPLAPPPLAPGPVRTGPLQPSVAPMQSRPAIGRPVPGPFTSPPGGIALPNRAPIAAPPVQSMTPRVPIAAPAIQPGQSPPRGAGPSMGARMIAGQRGGFAASHAFSAPAARASAPAPKQHRR